MINVSELFNSKIAESTRRLSARLMYGTEEISGEIRSIQIASGACSEGNFTVGAVFSSYIEVVIDECEDTLEDKELLLQIGLLVDDETIEYVDIGHYTVTKPKSSAYSTTFTAVGRITSKLNELFDVPEALTLSNIANAITTATGVTITFNGEASDAVLAKDITGITCKEALSIIAGTFGGFATEDNSGNIVVSKYNTDNKVSVDGDRMTALPEFNDYDYELYGVKVVVSAGGEDEDGNAIEEVAFTEGTPRLTVNNEFMTADLFESFVANTVGYTYRPGIVTLALGDPRLQPWDCLEVTDVKGNIHVVPCLNIVHTFDGGLSSTITAPGESESESSSSVAGPITQQIERLKYELITAQEAIIKRLKADDLEAEVAKLGYALIEELEAKIAEFGYAKTEKLDADYARLDQTNINQAWVMDLMITGNFLADDINAATGSFSKWLTGVNIAGDMITGGTIATERLIIRNPETNQGILYEINNGVVDQTGLTEEELKRLCLDGNILVAESVTADKINVTDLFSQNITATGNFNLGEGGALVYDADTDTLSIRVEEMILSSGMTVEESINSITTYTHAAFSIDGGETLAQVNLYGYIESGTLLDGEPSDSETFIRSSEYVKLKNGETYSWGSSGLDGSSIIPTTYFYTLTYDEETEKDVYTCSDSFTNAEFTVPIGQEVYMRFTAELSIEASIDYSYILTLVNLEEILETGTVNVYTGLVTTLSPYMELVAENYEWSLTDSSLLLNAKQLVDGVNELLYKDVETFYFNVDYDSETGEYTVGERIVTEEAITGNPLEDVFTVDGDQVYSNETYTLYIVRESAGDVVRINLLTQALQDSITLLDENLFDLDSDLKASNEALGALDYKLYGYEDEEGDINKIYNHLGYIVINPSEPSIALTTKPSKREEGSEVVLTSDKISFRRNNQEDAYIGYVENERTAMAATSSYVTEMFPRAENPDYDPDDSDSGVEPWIGSLCWVARSNGHYSLKVVK